LIENLPYVLPNYHLILIFISLSPFFSLLDETHAHNTSYQSKKNVGRQNLLLRIKKNEHNLINDVLLAMLEFEASQYCS